PSGRAWRHPATNSALPDKKRGRNVSRLLHFPYLQELVGPHIFQGLTRAGRPQHLDRGRVRIVQTKVEPFVIRRKIAPRSGRKSGLPIHANPCAHAVAVTACAAQLNGEPMRLAAAVPYPKSMRPLES